MRKVVFHETKENMNKQFIIQQDFNWDGTILHGLHQGSYGGLKILVDYIFQHVNTFDY